MQYMQDICRHKKTHEEPCAHHCSYCNAVRTKFYKTKLLLDCLLSKQKELWSSNPINNHLHKGIQTAHQEKASRSESSSRIGTFSMQGTYTYPSPFKTDRVLNLQCSDLSREVYQWRSSDFTFYSGARRSETVYLRLLWSRIFENSDVGETQEDPHWRASLHVSSDVFLDRHCLIMHLQMW